MQFVSAITNINRTTLSDLKLVVFTIKYAIFIPALKLKQSLFLKQMGAYKHHIRTHWLKEEKETFDNRVHVNI